MGITNNQKGQSLNKKEAKSNDKKDSKVNISIPLMTFNIFFDGTGNNMFNTKARLNRERLKLKGQTSYENYYSNIALLYMACTETDTSKKIYIMGSGTFKYGEDWKTGLGFAKGESGVYDRVTDAFKQINKIITNQDIDKIKFNVFGFSRGSFYARYFCAMAKLEPLFFYDPLNAKQAIYARTVSESGRNRLRYPASKININLVGLYDTVSSHGLTHYNDVKPFKLDIGKKQGIKKIVHLTAQNDYRNHFPLTHIDTAAAEGVGFECSFPGAHSDIGGAYYKGWEETQYLSVLDKSKVYNQSLDIKPGEISWQWYKDLGHYKGEPKAKAGNYGDFRVVKTGSVDHSGILPQVKDMYIVYANRKVASNCYQFILLEIMRDVAKNLASISFTGKDKAQLETDIKAVTETGGILKIFRDYAYKYVFANYKNSGLSFAVRADNTLNTAERRELYNKYIHNSLDASPTAIANGSDDRNKGPKRIDIHDNK